MRLSFWLFYVEKVSQVEKYLLFHYVPQHLCKIFVMNAVLELRGARFKINSLRKHW